MIVQFTDVGRRKQSWSSDVSLRPPTEEQLKRLVLKRGALMSRDIECIYDEGGETGIVYAGIREVGRFTLQRRGVSDAK